jgi:ribosomal-protein-alanine N-acetyltransferase
MNPDDVWRTFPILHTRRLRLRPMALTDAADHFAIYSNPDVMMAHGTPPYKEVEESQQLITWYAQAFEKRRAIRWAITLHTADRLIGSCGFHHLRWEHRCCEVGYELHPDYWRQGLMSEAVRVIVRFGFEQMGWHRIEAIVDPVNLASAGLLRQVGFMEEGRLRERFYQNGGFVDDWYFSMLSYELPPQEGE